MSILARHSESPFRAVDWEPEVAALLDERHLAAWSSVARRRVHFAACLSQFLGAQPDTEICPIFGRFITDLDSFCHQVERLIPGIPVQRRIDGPDGLTALLRSRHTWRFRPASKFRYFVWNDADVLIRHDHRLFGRLADAMMGVAAECEFASDDLLLIQRAVFVGGPMLDLYAQGPQGQLRSWYQDDLGEPFWRVVTGMDAPPVQRYQIDLLTASP